MASSRSPDSSKATSERFQKVERLLHSPEFRKVFKSGRCLLLDCVRIHYLPSASDLSRLGLVVSRKLGNAVTRNQIKRRLRDIFRRNKFRIPIPLDVIVVANAKNGPATYFEYAEAFEKFLHEAQRDPKIVSSLDSNEEGEVADDV